MLGSGSDCGLPTVYRTAGQFGGCEIAWGEPSKPFRVRRAFISKPFPLRRKGAVATQTILSRDGEVVDNFRFEYQNDSYGNWIEQRRFSWYNSDNSPHWKTGHNCSQGNFLLLYSRQEVWLATVQERT